MYKLKTSKNIFLTFCLSVLISMVIISCGSDTDHSDGPEIPETTAPLRVYARMSEISSSRAYQDEGPVTSGVYFLSYPNTSNIYSLASVDFDNGDVAEGIGIVTDTEGQELTWEDVEGTQPTFYMDNVPIQYSGQDPMIVTFDDAYNPFAAGIFDMDEGTNDLLWGFLTENRNAKTLNFDLHHNMARLVVEITTDESNSQVGALSLEEATVELTNLILSPASYNRQDGILSFAEEPVYENLTLVAPSNPDTQNPGIKWYDWEPNENNPNITIYITQDFVLPPQGLREDTERPRLRITLPNGTVYSGVVPYAMNVVNSTYPNGNPMTLSFLKEYILTLRTLVTEEPPELIFMPVEVVEWVDKGEFFMDGHQAGIYSASEFYKMLEYLSTSNYYQLQRYGNLETDNSWTFVMWNYINLEYVDIFNTYTGNITFKFQFNGYGVNVTNDSETKSVDATQLLEIVKGELTWENIPDTP